MNLEKLAFKFNLPSSFIANQGIDPRRWLLTKLPKNGVGCEIGVYKGDFSERLLYATNPTRLHLIDPWEKYEHGWGRMITDKMYFDVIERFLKVECVMVHRGYSSHVLANFPDNYFDWVYIDGDHQYSAVRCDLEIAHRVVKPYGIIAGDDYHANGWWGDDVMRAVNEKIQTRLFEVVRIEGGQYMLRNTKG